MKQEGESINTKKPSKLRLPGIVALVIPVIIFSIVSVSCSNPTNQTIPTPQASPTNQTIPTTQASSYPFSNTLILNDPLTNGDPAYGWGVHQTPGGNNCFFSGNAYHATQNGPHGYHACKAQKTNYSDFTFEVGMTIVNGSNDANGGVVFRAPGPSAQFYGFFLDPQGNYQFFVSLGPGSDNENGVSGSALPFFTPGFNQYNKIGVVVMGNKISLYINGQHVTDTQDGNNYYTSGEVGVIAGSKSSDTEVVYMNAKVWKLPG